jgi:TldD protein
MKVDENIVDDIESLIEKLQNDNEVAYAEVGAIFRDKSIISSAGDDIKRCSEISDSGVWCRVFADGAAGYRYIQDPESVSRIGSLALKRAQVLGQSTPAHYDTITAHEGSHTGWVTNKRNTDVDIDKKANAVRRGIERLEDPQNTRIYYEDVSRDDIRLTTTGGRIRTSIDRNWIDIRGSVDTQDGVQIKINQQAGSTLGFKDSADDLIDTTTRKLSEQRSRLSNHTTVSESGAKTATLSSSVAGQLFHQLSRYLEMDTIYFGSSLADIGDKITSSLICINDTVEPGNWAAIGFDGEGKLASPT